METQESTNKFLNLVFENWDGDESLPNCLEFAGNEEFNISDGFFHFYERYYHEHLGYNINSIPIKKWKTTDIQSNQDKKLFFPIKTSFPLKRLIVDDNFDLSDDIKESLKKFSNFSVLFIREHESEFEEDLVSLQKYIDLNNLPANQFIVLTNNFNLENIIIKNNIRFNVHKLNLLQLTSTSIFSEMKSTFNSDKSGKFFLCFNKFPKKHRVSTIALLDYYNLLNDVNWSMIGQVYQWEKHHYKPLFNDEMLEKINFEKYKDLELKESDFEIGKNYFNSDMSVNYQDFEKIERGGGASGGLMLPEFDFIYKESYVNIVTESIFEDMWNSIHITEKSFRPFYFNLFPIFVATHNHVKTIRDNYGFDLFDDMIDHSYDEEPNQIKRLEMIINEIRRIHKNKDKFIDFYKNNQHRFENNQNIVRNLSNDTKDYFYFKSLLS